ncbi:MAG TPA: CDP-6-deoxy-delta-3,4-glucoseen reductase [Burkholderiales bacterium]|jgi:CDP-4-dehydro-6-deoxyglucose reductase|nr:CDP-6-deoxy-delta-3,4-glucoseen reductase [Burkholderiales bacterium]
MSFRITIQPSGHELTVEEGESILAAALRHGRTLPYGCRNGACGACKGRILAGSVDYGNAQPYVLAEFEKKAGLALFCQARPLTDLVIEAREISAVGEIPIRKLPCRVQEMRRVAPDVMVLKLKLPANERLQFLAGQYIDILLKEGKRRSYSMANPPHDDEYIELHVRNMAHGAFTEYVFNRMKEKDILRFEGPLGTFFLREESDKPIIFVASGTGFAPIKSIIEHTFHVGSQRPMTLYWGGRRPVDIYLAGLCGQWQQTHDNFSFIPVISDALPEDNWQGRGGLVHRAVMEDFPDMSAYQVYACGAPVMVEAAHKDFTSLCQLPEEEFYSDAFTPSVDPKPVTS